MYCFLKILRFHNPLGAYWKAKCQHSNPFALHQLLHTFDASFPTCSELALFYSLLVSFFFISYPCNLKDIIQQAADERPNVFGNGKNDRTRECTKAKLSRAFLICAPHTTSYFNALAAIVLFFWRFSFAQKANEPPSNPAWRLLFFIQGIKDRSIITWESVRRTAANSYNCHLRTLLLPRENIVHTEKTQQKTTCIDRTTRTLIAVPM